MIKEEVQPNPSVYIEVFISEKVALIKRVLDVHALYISDNDSTNIIQANDPVTTSICYPSFFVYIFSTINTD